MTVTASVLRKDIYQLLDQVLATGKPLVVKRKSGVVKIVPDKPVSKLSKLKPRNGLHGDPEDIVHMDWSKEWKPCI